MTLTDIVKLEMVCMYTPNIDCLWNERVGSPVDLPCELIYSWIS